MNTRDLVTKFEAYLLTEKRVSQNTFAAYKQDLSQLVAFLEKEQLPIEQAKTGDLKRFLQYLHDRTLSARSIARKIAALKGLFTFLASRHGFQNAAEDLIVPKIKKNLPEYFSEQEIELLFQAAEQDTTPQGRRNQMMLYLMYVTGLRVSELVHLKIAHIMFNEGRIRIEGKGGRHRILPLPLSIVTMLKNYIKQELDSFMDKHGKTEYLFPIKYGRQLKPISRQAFWILLKGIWKKADIKKPISPHKLRHSFATHMLKRGVNLRYLQEMLGHENVATVQVYTHVETSFLRKIYDKKHPRS
jgi:integrase/recombinase XerD